MLNTHSQYTHRYLGQDSSKPNKENHILTRKTHTQVHVDKTTVEQVRSQRKSPTVGAVPFPLNGDDWNTHAHTQIKIDFVVNKKHILLVTVCCCWQETTFWTTTDEAVWTTIDAASWTTIARPSEHVFLRGLLNYNRRGSWCGQPSCFWLGLHSNGTSGGNCEAINVSLTRHQRRVSDTKQPCSWHEKTTVFLTRRFGNSQLCFWHDNSNV